MYLLSRLVVYLHTLLREIATNLVVSLYLSGLTMELVLLCFGFGLPSC